MEKQKALVVIDMQNDYLSEQRKAMFSYDTATLVGAVNRAILSAKESGYDIIYIAQIFPNIITNRWFIGFSIKGTPGARLYDKLVKVSDFYFEKNFSDTFSSRAFRLHVEQKQYSELLLSGLDECGCVGATARGALKRGLKVCLLEDCIASRFPKGKVERVRNKLIKLGARYGKMASCFC